MRLSAFLIALVATSAAAAVIEPGTIEQPNAVLINISEHDLNRIALGAFHAEGGPRLEGRRSEASSGVSDVSYHADLSDPVVRLGRDGRAWLSLNILEAELNIGRIERRFLRRNMTCENAGLRVDPDEPIDVMLAMRFIIEDGDVRVVPEALTITDPDHFKLRKPSKCRNTIVPKWLLWWIGKSRLRRQIEGMDERLLASAQESAAEWAEETDLLRLTWVAPARQEGQGDPDLLLYPQLLDTSHGSLLVTLAATNQQRETPVETPPDWVGPLSSSSFLGFSEAFLNDILRVAVSDLGGTLHQPKGSMSKVFNSRQINALIPGLEEVEAKEDLRVGFALNEPPVIEIGSAGDYGFPPETELGPGDDRAMIRLGLSGIEIRVWLLEDGEPQALGTLRVDSATVGLLPYFSQMGGIAFEMLENEWSVSSEGLEFDEPLFAALLQELLFSEVFETGYEPLARGALDIGETVFNPRYFRRMGRHLVIGLTGF